MSSRTRRTAYDAAERFADGVIHCLGVAFALMSAPVLVTLTVVLDGSPALVAAASVYGVAMIAMFTASALYHMVPAEDWRDLLRRLDHSAIYLKIAATQTPFAVFIGGAKTVWVLAGLWIAAGLGAAAKMLAPDSLRHVSLGLYLALGWTGLIVVSPAGDGVALTGATMALALTGGLLYSAGVPFFLMERMRFHNAIWHGFVLVATLVFYSAVVTELGLRAAR